MNAKTKITTLALTITALSGLLLAGCGEQPQASSGTGDDAQQQFLNERKGTPDPNFTPIAGISGGPVFFNGPGGGGAFGNVQKIDGRDITLLNPMDNTTKTVHLADDAKVTTQADATLSDIKVGDNISAVGKLDGDTLTAANIQIGGEGMAGPMITLGPGSVAGPGNNVISIDGSAPAGGEGSGSATTSGYATPGPILNGTPIPMPNDTFTQTAELTAGQVEKIDGPTITIKDPTGKTITIQTDSTTQFRKDADMPLTGIKEGMTMTAEGQQTGDIFEATSARILPTMQVLNP